MRAHHVMTLSLLLALALASFGLTACDNDDDGLGPGAPRGVETAVIVNSIDISVTVLPVDTPGSTRTMGLAPAGSPVSVAARNNIAIVPLGFFPAAAVIDLAVDSVMTIPLPDNSGATGVAFWNDSIAYVANPNLNSVSRINVIAGTATDEISVGVFPEAVIASSTRVFVLNAELDVNFQPAREGRVSVIDPVSNTVVSTIVLTGFNPTAAEVGPDGRLYIVNSGSFGAGNGSLSVVDMSTLEEIEHHSGFGEFPGDIAISGDGLVYVSAFAYGLAVWDAVADTFINSPDDPLVVQGNSTSSGVGMDFDGRIYSLIPGDCIAPSSALRLNVDLSFDVEITAGVCPFAIEFADVMR